ncbi:ornithine cyclodeaminase family protein [Nonomuraea sp. K274]|uniref:Ornithine cyclodeaminase family protein n=1 Tax=Nonomuraea cypriaca TaxID=1187855 RepID=A0A931A5Z8_9ACTN|nr:ornithine cyclodeaminase family protein [Nonomuraea cypriaca]MBF8185349.1 ornithine cyclodeaminase family protein [Nonomuraea cypriaca]
MGIPMIVDASGPVLSEAAVQALVREAFAQLAAGRAVQPQQVVTDLPDGGDVIAYQAVLADAGVYAVKVSPYLPQPQGKAIVTAWTLLLSTRTGQPLLLADAGRLTTERTAATTALAIDLLSRSDARSLAVVGLGPVGRAHLRHARAVRAFDDVRLYSRTATEADLDGLAGLGEVRLAGTADEAAEGADVVLLCTSAAAPVIDVRRLSPGTLVTSISTNAPMAHEIDPAALPDLDVYADHAPGAYAAAGDMRIATAEHGFTLQAIRGDLAGLVSGSAPAPTGDKPVFFRSVGLGIEDAAVALAVLETLS